jgi:hypothetical protein
MEETMGLFNRDYDRNFGYRGSNRGGGFGRGYDRDFGDRAEGTWDNMKRNTREFFGMENRYDRDLNSTYNRPTGRGGGYGARGGEAGYDRNFSSNLGYGSDYRGRSASGGYDRPYWGYDTWRYDDHYKSREQTDAGDPFGDRQSGTPIRVMDEPRDRGGWFGSSDYDRNFRYDQGMRGYDRGFRGGYGTDYRSANPMGYDPYDNRNRGTRNRGYDRDWF